MLKSFTLAALVLASLAGASAVPASAAMSCDALYEKAVRGDNSIRENRDAYIECVGRQ